MQDAAAPPIRNRITLAEGCDPTRTYLDVNSKRVSVAAFLAAEVPAGTWVDARGCTGLTSLDLPAAHRVDARGCTGLTSLDLPAATWVYASGCTGLTSLDLPAATWVGAVMGFAVAGYATVLAAWWVEALS